ncbi:MAG: DUF5683 domain-containing protein [Balneolales bacterium]
MLVVTVLVFYSSYTYAQSRSWTTLTPGRYRASVMYTMPDNISREHTPSFSTEISASAVNNDPALAFLHRQQQPVITASAMRLYDIFPGPRYVSFRDLAQNNKPSGFMKSISNTPGYAFLASVMVPGLGQAANRQWWKTAFFVAVEATAIGVYIHRENRGRDGERQYEEYGDQFWSVVKYAQYIADYHQHEHGYEFRDFLTNEGQQQYEENGYLDPEYNTDIDWAYIDREAVRAAEQNSTHTTGNPFSHTLQDYGSQQYYELMSKYHQFAPGWKQWDNDIHDVAEKIMPDDFLYHARIGYNFNNDLSVARNMLTVLVINHFIAAFDAYFTQQLRQERLRPTASVENGMYPTFGFNYRFY